MFLFGAVAVLMTEGAARAQWPVSTQANHLIRADGSSMVEAPPESGPMAPMEAAISFSHYAHKPKKSAVGHYSKALRAAQSNRESEALDRLVDAVRLDPDFFEAHLQAGILWIQNDSPARALPYLERALALDSSSQAAQALSAWALLALGRDAEAELALRRSMQLGKSFPVFDDMLRVARQRRGYASNPRQTTP